MDITLLEIVTKLYLKQFAKEYIYLLIVPDSIKVILKNDFYWCILKEFITMIGKTAEGKKD